MGNGGSANADRLVSDFFCRACHAPLYFGRIPMMAWLINWIRSFFGLRPQHLKRRNLMGMYFFETNKSGRRKSNRERY